MKLDSLLVDYRFGDVHDVREFLRPSYHLMQIAKDMQSLDDIINYNYSNIQYPLNVFAQPAAEASFSYSQFFWFIWRFSRSRSYIWLFPEEVAISRLGICIDTSNFVTALILCSRAATLQPAKVVLGRVYSQATGELLGYHAWVEVPGKWIETTIHRGQGNFNDIVFEAKDEKENTHLGIRYVADYKYDDKEVISLEDKETVRFLVFGPTAGDKASLRVWRKAEKKKQVLIWRASVEQAKVR